VVEFTAALRPESHYPSRRAGAQPRWQLSPSTLAGMAVASVFEQLEPLLPRVCKPVQYVGGELNATVKDWDATMVRWALMYPDAYEVGLPNQGI